ncbi:MAG: sensor histidine kinase, partial [Nitriliruptoraceae bacterium]
MSDPAEAGAATTGRYRGQDRRALEEPDRSAQAARAARWTLVAIGLAVVVVAVALTTASGMAGTEALAHLARGAALSLSLTLALGAQLFWRVSGVAAGFRLAAAGWLLGVALLIEVVDLHTVGPGAAAAVILHLSAALCAGHAAVGTEVDSGGGVLRQLATVGVPGVVAWLLGAVAVLSLSISGAQVMVAGCLLLAGTWAGVAVVGALRRPRSDPQPSWWLTGLAGGLATATLTRGLNGLLAADLSLTAAVLGVTALLIGAAGVYRALGHSAEVRRRALHRAQRAQRRSLDRRELADRELRHEARNALLAIEGAARTLRQQREHLDEQQRERLDHALANGIGHLHDLVLGDAEDQSTPVPVPVGDIVEQRAALTRTRGVEVEVDSRASHPNPRVLGHRRWLAQIVDNLLSNVEQHAVGDDGTPAARIAICADVAEVRVQVSDDGPGLPPGA